MGHWIFLSPHPDDVVYSCGGFIWEHKADGEKIEVWTLFDGDPPKGPLSPYAETLHARWKTGRRAMSIRRREDRAACTLLGVKARHLRIPECIYRRNPSKGEWRIHQDAELFQPLAAEDTEWVDLVAGSLRDSLPENTNLVSPLGIGGHVDHRLARKAAEKLGAAVWYYADYPYAASENMNLKDWIDPATASLCRCISAPALATWQDAAAAYTSQISTFWRDRDQLDSSFERYQKSGGGGCLWRL